MKTRKSITYLFRGLALGALMIAATGIYFGTTASGAGDDPSLRSNQVGIAYPSSENSQGLRVSAYWVQRDEREEMAYDELSKNFIGIPSPGTKITGRYLSDFAEAKDDELTRATTTFGDWSQPINIGPPLNTEFNDNYAVVTKNGLAIYFTSDRPGGFGGDDLWVSKRESVDSPWGDPENLGPVVNSQYADSLAVLDSSEHIMYFHSTRPGGCGETGTGDLWMSRRRGKVTNDNWSSPVNLGCIINTSATEIAPAFYENEETEEATLYFGSNRPGGIGDFDIYQSLSEEDHSFGSGVLVPELSSPKRDTRTFVRKDGREIFITSNRDAGVGLIDIWVSTRENPSATWSVPVNLGAVVNSSSDDGSPALSKDGTTLYFFSDRPGGHGQRDIWFTVRDKGDHEDEEGDDKDEDDDEGNDGDDEQD